MRKDRGEEINKMNMNTEREKTGEETVWKGFCAMEPTSNRFKKLLSFGQFPS